MKLHYPNYCLATLVLLSTFIAKADSSIDLLNLSFDELVKIKIKTTSKKEEPLYKTPGVLTVITSKDLKQYGARNLHDAMRLIPGIQQAYPQLTHRNAVAVRGQIAGATDKYFLILLNGVPIRDPMLHGINATIYEGIAISAIERLEVIKSPGSVVYGSNSFSGILNIITKTNESENSLSYSRGSFDSSTSELFLNKTITEELQLSLGLRHFTSDGWELAFTDPGGNVDSFNNNNTSWGAFFEVKYGNLIANFYRADVKEKATLSSGLISQATDRPSNRGFYSLNYNNQINAQWRYQATASLNLSTLAATTPYDAKDGLVEAIFHGEYDKKSYDIGVNFRFNKLIEPTGIEASNIQYRSIFAQATFDGVKNTSIVAGLRVTDPEISDINYSPRLSIVGVLSDRTGYKLVYSMAYSVPTGIELSFNLPGLFLGNKALKPIIVENYNMQYFYSYHNTFAALNLFYSKQSDIIGLTEVTPGVALPKQFNNTSDVNYKGGELEFKHEFENGLSLSTSYSYQTSRDKEGNDNTNFLSEHMVKVGLNYHSDTGLNLSLFNTFFSKPKNRTPLINEFNPSESSYSHLTLNASIEKTVFENTPMFVSLFIDNASNSSAIFLPDNTLSNLNTMPKIAERSYNLSFSIRF